MRPMQVLMEFPALTMTMPDGREESIMKRTCLVSSTVVFQKHGGNVCESTDATWEYSNKTLDCKEWVNAADCLRVQLKWGTFGIG